MTTSSQPAIPPVVRHFVACRSVDQDDSGGVAIRDPVHIIALTNRTPDRERQIWLYAILASGRGRHDFAVELVRHDPDPDRREHFVIRSEVHSFDLGSDPLAVFGLPIELELVDFRYPGQYSFYLLCGALRIAEEHITVR